MSLAPLRVPAPRWSELAVERLLDTIACPVCNAQALQDRVCRRCGADYSGSDGADLWQASQAAAEALRVRQSVLARVPRVAMAPAPLATPASAQVHTPVAPTTSDGSSATVQSVLAVAGAGLFAVAAIVFTFFNPDLTDRVPRSVIVAAVTVLFVLGARLLARRRLRFSAEAVGALGMVFVGLDVYAVSELAPASVSPWWFAAAGTLLAGAAMTAFGLRAGIRTWVWVSLVALALVPAMLGAALTTPTAAAAGWLAAGFAAWALLAFVPRVAHRFDGRLRSERVALTVVELLAFALAVAWLPFLESAHPIARQLAIAAALAGVTALGLLSTRHLVARLWSTLAGAAGTAALVALAYAFQVEGTDAAAWALLLGPAAAVLGVVLLGAVLPLPRRASRRFVAGGALAVAALLAVVPLGASLLVGASALLAEGDAGLVLGGDVAWVVLGLAVIGAGLGGYAALTRPVGDEAHGTRWLGELAVWFAAASALTVVSSPGLATWTRVSLGLALAVAASGALVLVPRLRAARIGYRLPLIVGAHLALVLCIVMSWRDDALVVGAGAGIVVAIAVVARTIPAPARFVYVGAGYAYALIVFGHGLGLLGVASLPLLCLTTSLAALGAIAATFLPRVVGAHSWYAILAVTAVPFALGVLQVVFERSGWTALSTGLIFLLALSLVVTRRPGLGLALRALAAGILVPSLAVVVVCLGAQVLVDSGSPVVLPIIATIVAVVLPSTGLIRAALVGHGIGERDASAARVAIEASALLTGAIAVLLGLLREAAGLGTTFLVLIILGIGTVATARGARRPYGWWAAGAAFTGALWCVWGMAGVDVVEPYLLPPALGAAVVGAVLTTRGRRAVALYATGLAVATLPVLVLLALQGTPAAVAWRALGLVAASWLLLLLGVLLRGARVGALRLPTLAVAIAAGAGGAVEGVRLGLGLDAGASGLPLVVVCASIALLGAMPAAGAARIIHISAAPGTRLARTRWLFAPAALYVAVGTWTAIHRDWFTIWAMWALMLAFLTAMLLVAGRLRTRRTSLPPVWFLFAIAFVTAVVAWSPRDLRVEWFSLPLGLFLVTAGALLLRVDPATDGRTIDSWPRGWRGSWALIAPGLVAIFGASVTATFTDPQTWRAILVIVLALVAILVGASMKLAAPFLIGVVVLPIENVVAFVVQIGRGIESMPWWITLAVVGAVLLIIAVTYERRADGDTGIAARLRDLA